MSFSIEYDKQPEKFLIKLDKLEAKRIIDRIENSLSKNLVPSDVKVIVGHHGVFRLRMGDYRALYRINYPDKKIIIFQIDKRSRIY